MNNKFYTQEITLKELLKRHSYFYKEEKKFYYMTDIIVDTKILSCKPIKNEDTVLYKSIDNMEFDICRNVYLELSVIHCGNNVSFEFMGVFGKGISDRKELEAFGKNEDILENLYSEVNKLGNLNKTKNGFNLKINICDAARYRGENIYVYLKSDSVEDMKKLKKLALKYGFSEKEMVYDICEYNNFFSMYERYIKEGDLVVIPDLSMIKTDIKSLNQFILKFLDKKVSFCIDGYEFLYYVYEQCSKDEIANVILEFIEFCLEKKNLIKK